MATDGRVLTTKLFFAFPSYFTSQGARTELGKRNFAVVSLPVGYLCRKSAFFSPIFVLPCIVLSPFRGLLWDLVDTKTIFIDRVVD